MLTKLSVTELSRGLAARDFSSCEVTQAYLTAIEQQDDQIGAYLTVAAQQALEQAKAVDSRRAHQPLSLLAGVPMALKDNICTKGMQTSCASKMLKGFCPPYNATAAEKLLQEDAILLGKLNMDEFAMGSSTENSAVQLTRNPRARDRVPGGSSGGSAAAVAAGEAAFALGSDTGGSIRQPAAFCGVVGMKPTYGTVSRYGLVAFASSFDQIGPLTRTVADNALVLNYIAGKDTRDATSLDKPCSDYTSTIGEDIKGVKIALPDEMLGEGVAADVRQAVETAANRLEELGAHIITGLSMPTLQHALEAYYVISSAEASSNLARFDGVRYGYRAQNYEDMQSLYRTTRSEGFGAEVKRRIMLGTFALSAGYYDAYYKKAQEVRTLVREDYIRILKTCDMILSPVAPTVAYRIGEKVQDPMAMYLGDLYTVPVNIAGLPALSLPCGINSAGLPVGMQLIGPSMGEQSLYRVGGAYEQAFGTFDQMKEGRQ